MKIKLLFLMFSLCACAAIAQDRNSEVLRRINEVRQSHGLDVLVEDSRLAAAARGQSEWMASVGRMDHLRGEASSAEQFRSGFYHPANRVVQSGYFSFDQLFSEERVKGGMIIHPRPAANQKVGEIIAKGWGGHDSGSPDRVVAGWMNSPGHRSQILKGEYREAGVGVTSLRPGEYYWCVVFAYR